MFSHKSKNRVNYFINGNLKEYNIFILFQKSFDDVQKSCCEYGMRSVSPISLGSIEKLKCLMELYKSKYKMCNLHVNVLFH
jgi:hypothetical protein